MANALKDGIVDSGDIVEATRHQAIGGRDEGDAEGDDGNQRG